mgnify:CR=1 FL=1
MAPTAYICHRIDRRIRVRIPEKKGDVDYFSLLKRRLAEMKGIERCELNPTTGSILFTLSEGGEEVGEFAVQSGLFRLESAPPSPPRLTHQVKRSFSDLNGRVTSFTGGSLNLGEIAFLCLMGVGIYQVSLGEFLIPAWYTAFWYAMNIQLKSAAS